VALAASVRLREPRGRSSPHDLPHNGWQHAKTG